MSEKNIFAERLRALRATYGYSQTEFGDKAGVSRMAQRYYETGQRTPNIDYLRALHENLGVEPGYLLGWLPNAHAEHVPLGIETGLSDRAIDNLAAIQRGGGVGTAVSNALIGHVKYVQLVDSLREMMVDVVKAGPKERSAWHLFRAAFALWVIVEDEQFAQAARGWRPDNQGGHGPTSERGQPEGQSRSVLSTRGGMGGE